MNTQQLDCAIKSDHLMKNYILGAYPADQTNIHLPPKHGLILNTDHTDLAGRHWNAFFFNENRQLECFDSFGNSPDIYSPYIHAFMKRFSNVKIKCRMKDCVSYIKFCSIKTKSFIDKMDSTQQDLWWEKESLVKIESPSSILIVGPSGSGKTELTKKLLYHANGVFKKKPSKIMFCYNVWQPLYDEIVKNVPNITFSKGLPTVDDVNEWSASDGHKILLFDDLMIDAADNLDVVNMFCVGSHHFNITVIHLVQNLFMKGKAMRCISLNSHYFILFRNHRDQLQIQTFGRQVFPGMNKYFMDAYNKATSELYGYLLVDLSPHSDKKYQLRSKILQGDTTTVFEPKI